MKARRAAAWSGVGLLLLAQSAAMAQSTAVLEGPAVRIEFEAGLPVRWLACSRDCSDPGARRLQMLQAGATGSLTWHAPGRDDLAAEFSGGRYEAERDGYRLTLRSREPLAGRLRSHRYVLDPSSGRLTAELDLPEGIGLRLATGPAFIPEPLPGFGALYGDVRPVRVGPMGQVRLDDPDEAAQGELPAGQWVGIRNRFWALLLQSDSAEDSFATRLGAPNQPRVELRMPVGSALAIYAGPIDWDRLGQVDPVLRELLFAALWDWLRWLCVAMLKLLGWLQAGVGNAGVAIILLSVGVKLLMWPLTRIADRWQSEVNRTQARLQPQLDAIKREFKGEDAHNRVLAAYKEQGVSQFYTLRSLAGVLIQIPVFIAAFDMLGENFALNGATFLWIEDLAKPDQLAPLPFDLPFFGGQLNLLPLLMTGFTLLASILQTDADLTPALLRQQRQKLFVMAAAFFALFYTFPAGMVLYWTTNNVLHLLKLLWRRLLGL